MTTSLKNVPLFYAINVVVGILCSVTATGAKADITTAKNWLTKSPTTNSQIANPLQTQEEVALTLSHLQTNVTLEKLNTSVENETSTEGLVRLILIAKAKNQPLPIAWQNLLLNQNEDGGFGHIEGWQSNPLDTAYVLIALQESGYLASLDKPAQAQWQANIAKALDYLASQQQSDGGYKIAYLDDLYINSYVLSAFTPYLKQYGQYLPVAQKLVATLQSKQTSAGTWSSRANNTGLFIDALVAESLYPYQSSDKADSFKTTFTNRVLALQNANGSWQQDAYVTAVVLRSLDTLAKPATNPITSGISLSVIDAESGIALTDAVLTANGVKVSSDSSGNVIVNDAQAGTYQFTLTRAGYAPVNFTVNLQQGEQLNLGQIRLSRSASIETAQIQGTVTDKTTQAPITNATVTIVLVNETGGQLVDFEPIIATTDAKGRYQVVLTKEQLTASKGKFNVHVASQGYNEISGSGMVQAGGVAMFSPTLTSTAAFNASLTGKIVDDTGQPLAGATLEYQGKPVATADSTGSFVVNNLPMGSGQWQIQLAGYQSVTLSLVVDQSIAYNAGTITLPKVKLTDPNNPNSEPLPASQGSFIVTPMDSRSGKLIDNFNLIAELLDSNNQTIQTQTFNATQVNQSLNLPTGRWRLTINHESYQSASQIFNLEDKQAVTYAPKLNINPYAISGRVVDSINNQPISNTTFKVIDSSNNTVIYTGTTDNQGAFTTSATLTAVDMSVEISPALYLPTTRSISRTSENNSIISMGEIRLRPKTANVVLPDLFISKLTTDDTITDSQSLIISGKMGVTIGNRGNTSVISKSTKVLAFLDTNHNHKFDKDERIIGNTTVDLNLTPSTETIISLPISGKLNFRGAPIAVMVDSDRQIAESNKNNNVRLTNEDLANPINFNNKRDLTPTWSLNEAVVVSPLVSSFIKENNEIVNGVFYINQTGTLKAIDGRNGKELWQQPLQLNQNNNSIDHMIIASLDKAITKNKYIFVTDIKNKKILQINLLGEIIATIDIPADQPITSDQLSSYYNNDNKLILITEEGLYDIEKKTWTFFKARNDQLKHGGNLLSFFDDSYKQQLFLVNGTFYKEDGNILLNKNIPVYMTDTVSNNDSYVLGDFDNDGFIDVATKTCSSSTANSKLNIFSIKKNSQLMQLNGNNDCRFKESLITTDFNGDSIPDIFYDGKAVLNDGSVLWQLNRDNFESLQASAFDFNNDAKNEVVVNRAQGMNIYDGLTGISKWTYKTKTGANSPNPIIADLNGDGATDILLPSSNTTCTDLMDFKDSPLDGTDTKVLIRWGGGPDLDINTEFDNTRYGWNYNSSRRPYIQWLGDNTSGGPERVMVNAQQAFKDNIGVSNNSLILNIGAAWYSSYGTDNWAQVEVATKDGRCFSGYLNNIRQSVSTRSPEYKISIPSDITLPITAENLLTGTNQPLNDSPKIMAFHGRSEEWGGTRNFWNSEYFIPDGYENDESLVQNPANPIHTKGNIFVESILKDTDLTTSYLQIKDNGAAPSQFSARIGNAGGKNAPAGTPVSFYQKDSTGQTKLLGVVKLPKDLASDEYVDLNLDYSPLTGTLNGFGELIVVANDAGAGIDSATGIPNPTDPNVPVNNQGVIQEYSRANNLASLSITGDFAGFSLSGSLDKTSYTANDTVKISSIATNLGSFATTPTLKVSIIDSAGNVVTTYPEQVVKLGVAMAGQPIGDENSTTVQNFWNTSQQRIGNYTAHIELINNNQTVGSVDKPFAIVADGVKTGQVDSQLAVDKTQYNTTDLVQIHSRLINTASNAMATARNVVLTVKNATGQQIWTQSYNYSELAPNVIKDQYFTVPLKNAPSGSYSVTSTTTAPDGTQTTQTLNKAFEVLSAAQTGINVTGTIQAPTSISIGQEMPLDWTISNNNAQAITNLPVAIALYRNDETTPFATIPANELTLDANGKITGNSKWLSAGNENDKITAVLTATFGSTTKGLATTTFNLVQTPIKVDFSNHSTAKNDTLLVYYACEDGWYTSLNNSGAGKFDYPCFNERENTIRSYLDRMGVNYKLVKTPWDFRHELQSGIYGQYWLLGAIENLSPHLYNEVVELSNTGQNILFDSGTHSWLNQDLYKLANVKYNGRLLLETGEILPNPTYFPAVADSEIANSKLSTQTKLAGQPFNSNWAIMLEPKSSINQSLATFSGSPKQVFGINQSNYPNQSYNAITAATYGNGVPVVAAFDLISSLDFANKTALPPYKNNASTLQLHWDSVLNQLLVPRRIAPRSDYAPSEPVSIPMSLQNPSDTDKRIQVDVILPQGSQWLGYQGGVNTSVSNTLDQHYQVTLKPGQTLQDILMVRLPNIAGTHGVKITVSDITDSSQPIKLDQLEARFLVRDIASRVALLKQTIQKWSSVGTNGLQFTNAKVKISLIQTHLSTGVDELAVYEAGNLAHIISDMQPTATQDTVAIRYEVDELLRALQIKWYLARNGKTPLP